jgi:hypothetical protein
MNERTPAPADASLQTLVTPNDLALDENLWAAPWAKVGVDIRCVR